MPFEEIKPAAKDSKHTGASAGLVKMRGGPAALRINFRREVLEAMGFASGERLVALVGTDEDHGLLRLRKDKHGPFKLDERGLARDSTYWSVNLGRRPEFVDRTEKAVPCQWEKIDLVTVEIVLPPWAEATRPKGRALLSATPPSVAAGRLDVENRKREEVEAEARRARRAAEDEAGEWSRLRKDLVSTAPRFHASLQLTATEAALLALLVDRAGKPVRSDGILTVLYGDKPDDPPDDKIIAVWVSKLRRKIEPSGCRIETVHGEGYRLAGATGSLVAEHAA